jgi:hypothetical protein
METTRHYTPEMAKLNCNRARDILKTFIGYIDTIQGRLAEDEDDFVTQVEVETIRLELEEFIENFKKRKQKGY